MLTKTKIALVAALVAGSATAASAQGFDPNPATAIRPMPAPRDVGALSARCRQRRREQRAHERQSAPVAFVIAATRRRRISTRRSRSTSTVHSSPRRFAWRPYGAASRTRSAPI